MPAPASVDAPGGTAVVSERDLDARLVMLIVAARVSAALEELYGAAAATTTTVIPGADTELPSIPPRPSAPRS